MKRILGVLTTLFLALSCFCMPVSAQEASEKKCITVFGDSLAAGFGLEDFVPSDNYHSQSSFASLVAVHFGAKAREDYYNFATSGWTSAQILASVKTTDPEILKKSDVILISCGANDILTALEERLAIEMENQPALWTEPAAALSSPTSIAPFTTGFSTVLAHPAAFRELIDRCTEAEAGQQMKECAVQYENNLREMVDYLRKTGCEGTIMVILPYNPVAAVGNSRLADLADTAFQDLHRRTAALTDSDRLGDGVEFVDLLSVFENRYQDLTLVREGDIHPNRKGHETIAESIIRTVEPEVISQNPLHPAPHKALSEEKKPPYSDGIVYSMVVLAVLAVIGIVLQAIILHKKKQ